MSGLSAVAGVVEVIGGIVVAPFLPGLVQTTKATLQGRRGSGPLQPYRELRRLWSKGTVDVEGSTLAYRLAPAVVAASLFTAILLVPVAARSVNWGVGHDALALAGVLALARFAITVAVWDTGNGFGLMGASRDLTMAVFVEAALVLSLAVAALGARTTDLRAIIAATAAGGTAWTTPALALGGLAFAVVVVAETGRQPVDNPDTHLELTMIHEGPLLEYAGRDLAYLQWAAAARHWVVLVLAAQIFVPHLDSVVGQLAVLPATLFVLCLILAAVETLLVKMRILLVPRLLGVASAVALCGVVTAVAGR